MITPEPTFWKILSWKKYVTTHNKYKKPRSFVDKKVIKAFFVNVNRMLGDADYSHIHNYGKANIVNDYVL